MLGGSVKDFRTGAGDTSSKPSAVVHLERSSIRIQTTRHISKAWVPGGALWSGLQQECPAVHSDICPPPYPSQFLPIPELFLFLFFWGACRVIPATLSITLARHEQKPSIHLLTPQKLVSTRSRDRGGGKEKGREGGKEESS